MRDRASHLFLLDNSGRVCPSCHGSPGGEHPLTECVLHGVPVCNGCHTMAVVIKLDEAGLIDERIKAEVERCA